MPKLGAVVRDEGVGVCGRPGAGVPCATKPSCICSRPASRRPSRPPAGRATPLGLAGLALTAAASVARGEVGCPDQLRVAQRAEAPSGWSVSYSEVAPRLAGVTIFDGPPANRVNLKHDRRRQTAKELILVWDLRDSPRSHYLLCSYERSTAQISTALPPGTRQCEVVFDRTTAYPGGALPVKRMVCR